MRRMIILATTVAIYGFTAIHSANAAAYTFTQIDVPGASATTANGINDAGQIVGWFNDSTGTHGFLYTGGSFTPIAVPGATFSQATGINDAGQIVGPFIDSTGGHGFLDVGGSFTQIDVPGALFTQAYGINNAGQIVGFFGTGGPAAGQHGFVDTAGIFTTFDAPGTSGDFVTRPSAINAMEQIVGTFINFLGSNTEEGSFLRQPNGSFTTIDVPGAIGTSASGINDAGQIVGSFTDNAGFGYGFLEVDDVFTILDVPGGIRTEAHGINDAGRIVGSFGDSTGEHGFLATPVSAVPEPSSVALLEVGVIGLGLFRRRQRSTRADQHLVICDVQAAWSKTHKVHFWKMAHNGVRENAKSHEPRDLRHLQDGRGRGAATDVCQYPMADSPATRRPQPHDGQMEANAGGDEERGVS